MGGGGGGAGGLVRPGKSQVAISLLRNTVTEPPNCFLREVRMAYFDV